MLHIEASTVAAAAAISPAPTVPKPSIVNVAAAAHTSTVKKSTTTTTTTTKMDDRKRSASEQDDASALPPAKRQAVALVNGEDVQPDSGNVKFGPAGSPWQVDLAVCFDFFLPFSLLYSFSPSSSHGGWI
jgi:hypothetical protein